MQFAGVFKDDPHFDEFQQSIQDYRQEIDTYIKQVLLGD